MLIFIWPFLKPLLMRYIRAFDYFGLIDKTKWIICQLLILGFSFIFAISMYFYLYSTCIPIMDQASKLYFQRTEYGYFTRVFSSEGNFPACRGTLLSASSNNLSKQELVLQKSCINLSGLGASSLKFEDETYRITIKISLRNTNDNIQHSESIPIVAEFINEESTVHSVELEAVPTIEKFSLQEIMKGNTKTVRLDEDDLVTEAVLSEKFVNSMFHLNVLNIEIKQPNILINNGIIELKVKLGGIRKLIYEWFWISMFIAITFLTLSILIGINLLWGWLIEAKNSAMEGFRRLLIGGRNESFADQKRKN